MFRKDLGSQVTRKPPRPDASTVPLLSPIGIEVVDVDGITFPQWGVKLEELFHAAAKIPTDCLNVSGIGDSWAIPGCQVRQDLTRDAGGLRNLPPGDSSPLLTLLIQQQFGQPKSDHVGSPR